MTTTIDSRPVVLPTPRPVPAAERVAEPDDGPEDWAAAYPLLRYAAEHLEVLGRPVIGRRSPGA
jgi:hypothetical protein